jgi:hypothetical protein
MLVNWLWRRLVHAPAYDARELEEPLNKVRFHVYSAWALALVLSIAGYTGDRFGWATSACGRGPCHWFQRSGALVVVCGTYLAFRSGSVLFKRIQHADQRPMRGVNDEESRIYGVEAFALLFIGTLIWDFGDLLRS